MYFVGIFLYLTKGESIVETIIFLSIVIGILSIWIFLSKLCFRIYFSHLYLFLFFIISEVNVRYRSVLSIAAYSPRVLGHVKEGACCTQRENLRYNERTIHLDFFASFHFRQSLRFRPRDMGEIDSRYMTTMDRAKSFYSMRTYLLWC